MDLAKKAKITRLTEIKTTHIFLHDEIIAVLIPQDLHEFFSKELHEWFSGKIISVPYTKKSICKIPDILEILHGEKISEKSSTIVPDYENVLRTKISKQCSRFALHAVRLHTLFDFTLRYVENMSKSSELLKKAEASTLVSYSNGGGWIAVHQTKTFQTALYQNKDYLSGYVLSAWFDNTTVRADLMAAKGRMKMSRCVPDKESSAQFIGRGISSIPDIFAVAVNYGSTVVCPKVMMLSYPEARQKIASNPKKLAEMGQELEVKEVKEKAETQEKAKQNKAALVFQKNYKRHLVRKDFCVYYKLHKETQALLEKNRLEEALSATTGLIKIRDKLYSRVK